jgi:hypothetical protein
LYPQPPLFKWCPSLGGFIPFFPFRVALFSFEFKLKVSMEYAYVVKALTLLAPTLAYSKTIIALCFIGFSSFGFILAMLRFFDRILIGSRLGFLKKHV